ISRGGGSSLARPVSRTLGFLIRCAVFLAIALVVAEAGLQIAARFAHGRATTWRADARHRILCIGDSHTYGVLLPVEQSYPGPLQRMLDEREPGAYSVVNLGLPGLNTTQVRERLHAALAADHPETVIVWCGVNDAWNRGESTEGRSGWRARVFG